MNLENRGAFRIPEYREGRVCPVESLSEPHFTGVDEKMTPWGEKTLIIENLRLKEVRDSGIIESQGVVGQPLAGFLLESKKGADRMREKKRRRLVTQIELAETERMDKQALRQVIKKSIPKQKEILNQKFAGVRVNKIYFDRKERRLLFRASEIIENVRRFKKIDPFQAVVLAGVQDSSRVFKKRFVIMDAVINSAEIHSWRRAFVTQILGQLIEKKLIEEQRLGGTAIPTYGLK